MKKYVDETQLDSLKSDVADLVWSDISGYSTTRRNLAYNSAITDYNLNGTNQLAVKLSDYKWHCKKATTFAGLQINGSIFELGKTYTMSYRAKKISGTLSNFGHHKRGFDVLNMTINGEVVDFENEDSESGIAVTDNTSEYYVVLTLKLTDLSNFTHLYIQPNRGDATAVEFYLWDIKVEQGNGATYWTPAPEDFAVIDTITSLEARIAALEENINQ